jgi:hypothetical protein
LLSFIFVYFRLFTFIGVYLILAWAHLAGERTVSLRRRATCSFQARQTPAQPLKPRSSRDEACFKGERPFAGRLAFD